MGCSNRITYAVHCPRCRHNTPKTIAWLTVHNEMPCAGCRRMVNLEAGENATIIHGFAKECARLDAVAAKRS